MYICVIYRNICTWTLGLNNTQYIYTTSHVQIFGVYGRIMDYMYVTCHIFGYFSLGCMLKGFEDLVHASEV